MSRKNIIFFADPQPAAKRVVEPVTEKLLRENGFEVKVITKINDFKFVFGEEESGKIANPQNWFLVADMHTADANAVMLFAAEYNLPCIIFGRYDFRVAQRVKDLKIEGRNIVGEARPKGNRMTQLLAFAKNL